MYKYFFPTANIAQLLTTITLVSLPVTMATIEHAVSSSLFLLLVISLFTYKKNSHLLTREERLVLLAMGLAAITYLIGIAYSNQWYLGWRMAGRPAKFLFAIPILILMKACIEQIKHNIKWGLILSGPALMFAIYIHHDLRVYIGAYHSIIFGDFSILIFGIGVFWLLLAKEDGYIKFLLFASMSLCFGASLWSGARGAWISLPLLVLLMVVTFFKEKNLIKIGVYLLAGFIGVFVVVAALFPNHTLERIEHTYSAVDALISKGDTSKDLRLKIWQGSIEVFRRNPIIGTGTGDFAEDLRAIANKNKELLIIKNYTSAHNIFLDWLTQFGIIGFVILVIVVFILPLGYFISSMPENHLGSIIGIWCIGAHVAFGLTESWFIRSAPIGVFLLFTLFAFALIDRRRLAESAQKD